MPAIDNATLIADAAWCEMQKRQPTWSVDRLLCNPRQALTICHAVRRQFPSATDQEICTALLNARKRGKLN